jgi:phosphatidylglycerophosphate synthase
VAAVVVALVSPTRVTPNQITLLSYVVAMVAAAMMVFCPGYTGLLLAVLVYEFSYVLDCADGMLARWRGIQSKQGHLLDFLMDELKAFAILAAASVRLYLERGDVNFLFMGLGGLLCLASGIAMTTFERRPEIAGEPKAAPPASKPSPLKLAMSLPMRLAKFLIHYPSYILFVAIAGRLEFYLYPYVAINALYVLRSLAVVALRFGRT